MTEGPMVVSRAEARRAETGQKKLGRTRAFLEGFSAGLWAAQVHVPFGFNEDETREWQRGVATARGKR